jgi:hypothetical protein
MVEAASPDDLHVMMPCVSLDPSTGSSDHIEKKTESVGVDGDLDSHAVVLDRY